MGKKVVGKQDLTSVVIALAESTGMLKQHAVETDERLDKLVGVTDILAAAFLQIKTALKVGLLVFIGVFLAATLFLAVYMAGPDGLAAWLAIAK